MTAWGPDIGDWVVVQDNTWSGYEYWGGRVAQVTYIHRHDAGRKYNILDLVGPSGDAIVSESRVRPATKEEISRIQLASLEGL